VVSQPFKRGAVAMNEPVFSTPRSIPFFHFMRAYNRRLARIARARRLGDRLGRRNAGRRFMFQGYTFASASSVHIARGVAAWAWLELKEGWRSWFTAGHSEVPIPDARRLPSAHPQATQTAA